MGACLRHRRRRWLGRGWRRARGCIGLTGPDQSSPYVINDRRIGIQDGIFEILKIGVIQVELSLESAIRDTAQALEHRDGLRQDLFECHDYPSACLDGFRISPPMAYLTRRFARTPCVAAKALPHLSLQFLFAEA
jgi:hypothetical protein